MNKNQKVLFMSGFPRAGSTLLMNILGQNPLFYPTPTSGLVANILHVRDNWRGNDIFKSNGEEYIFPKIKNLMKYSIIGFYADQIKEGKIPIDKNRMWPGNIDLLESLFDCKIKIIYPIRHVIDCCISMEKKNRQGVLINHGDNGNWLNEQSSIGRAENFIKDDGVFGLPLLYLREALYRNFHDRFVFVKYEHLLTNPIETLNKIHDELEIEKFQYDFNNIKQVTFERDMDHGFAPNSLHQIKEGKLESPKPRDLSVFNEFFINQIENERYKDVTDFINSL
jgi:sulfotransferase